MVDNTGVSIFYDGRCPFCQSYVRLLRLREICFPVRLIDIRLVPELAQALSKAGYDLEQGMLVMIGESAYHGADAMHVLALLSEPDRRLNRLHYLLLRSRRRARVLYPLLKLGRRMALLLLGQPRIN